ncbi:MAG: hypothetical protein OXE87_13425 [Chloroflexi bacterium]|nr:hypothetical protein [Chloroflexota bacterium]
MTINVHPTDSLENANPAATPQYPYNHYPPYSRQYLRNLLERLCDVSGGDLAGRLPSLTEPALYALAAAVTLNDGFILGIRRDALAAPLRDELRWRACRAMGTDPTGPTRRGRLVQMVGTFTTLTVAGVSESQRQKLVGTCPFCGSTEFQLILSSVHWRCFTCGHDGGLLEFAERLLETRFPFAS